MAKRKNNDRKTRPVGRGGVFSLVLGIVLALAGALLVALQFVAMPAMQPVLEPVIRLVFTYLSIGGGETLSAGILLLVLSLVVLTSRRGRPFNYIYLPLALVVYYTALGLYHMIVGNPAPAFLMEYLGTTKLSLVAILLILEVLVVLVISVINTSLNGYWRRHAARKAAATIRQSADEAAIPGLDRKAEKARLKAEKKAARERKGEKEEPKDMKVTVKAESEARVTLDPDSPLAFPETVKVPSFNTIPSQGAAAEVVQSALEGKSVSVDKSVEEELSIPSGNVVSMSVLENSARNVERKMAEDARKKTPSSGKRLFTKGGMLESALESAQKESAPSAPNPNPIIGYSDRRKEASGHASESFAPSNLSPNHPRYKLFESLRRRNDAPQAEGDVSHFPGRPFEEEPAAAPEASSLDDRPSITLKEEVAEEAKAQPRPASPAPAVESASGPEIVPEPVVEKESVPASPVEKVAPPATHSHAKAAAVKPAPEPVGEEEDILDAGDAEDGDNSSQIEFKVGVSGLASNNAGEQAIIQRQRRSYNPPSADLLKDFPETSYIVTQDEEAVAEKIASVMHDFRVEVSLADIVKGPTVTLYEFTLAPGVLVSKVMSLEDNIAMSIGGQKIRILAPVPGKSAVGIEVPNAKRATVGFKELLGPLREARLNVPMILGRDIQGTPKLIDVAKCPHLLIAGTTGSGKSVCINGLVASILYTKSPKEVRLIMVDPKVVELNVYNGIPHLLTPVITEPKRVLKMLNWLVGEMDRRYNVFSQLGVRNIENFNARIKEFGYATEKMPYIVLIMDEFADLMTVIGKDIEDYIRRIMAKARAAGIHVVMATQRPSAEVVTGTIKNNIPTRIAFTASSAMNSRIILDETGAENLLGKGDMLLSTQSSLGLVRIQGAFLSEEEVDKIVRFVKTQGEPDYLDEAIFEDDPEPDEGPVDEEDFEGSDADLYEKAKAICFERKGASASYLQRRLSIGYNRAARLVEQMEEEGIVGPANGSKPREILRYE